jgi:hypothetical protein
MAVVAAVDLPRTHARIVKDQPPPRLLARCQRRPAATGMGLLPRSISSARRRVGNEKAQAVRPGVQVSGRAASVTRLSFRSGRLVGRLDHRVQLTRKALADGLKGDVGLGLAGQVDQRDHRAQFVGPHYFTHTNPFARMQSARRAFLIVIV